MLLFRELRIHGLAEDFLRIVEDGTDADELLEIEEELKDTPEDLGLSREYNRLINLIEARDGYQAEVKIRRVLNGMGFSNYDLDMPVGALSGGEKTRLAVAKLLLENCGTDIRSCQVCERKVRTPQSRIPFERTGRRWQTSMYGKCNRKYTATQVVRVKRRCKRPPPTEQSRRAL